VTFFLIPPFPFLFWEGTLKKSAESIIKKSGMVFSDLMMTEERSLMRSVLGALPPGATSPGVGDGDEFRKPPMARYLLIWLLNSP
jgi:hypothetical protein